MSRLAKMIQNFTEIEEAGNAIETRKTAVTIRLGDQGLWRLDFIRNRFTNMSRSRMTQEITEEALVEAMEALGYDSDAQFEMYIEAKKAEREAK